MGLKETETWNLEKDMGARSPLLYTLLSLFFPTSKTVKVALPEL